MAVNNLTTEQSYVMMNALYSEATGTQSTLAIVDTATFTTVAQAIMKTGYDNVLNAIGKVISKTIFKVRPYTAKFKSLETTAERFGSIIRKIEFIDSAVESDQRLPLTEGQSVDMFTIKKPKVVELNFVGEHMYQDHITIFRDQLDGAFHSPQEFASFISSLMTEIANKLEQYKEQESRSAMINMIGAKKAGDTANFINVLQVYKDETGTALTPATMYTPENLTPFVKWLYGYVNTLTDRMSERSIKYHMNVSGKPIVKHTPFSDMRAYMSSRIANQIDSNVLSTIFHPDKLKMIEWESVSYWQNIDNPESIKATVTYMKPDGTLTTATAQQVDNIIGVIFDRDAMGIVDKSTWMASSPFNPAGGYTNTYWHRTISSWNCFIENCVVLYAETPT